MAAAGGRQFDLHRMSSIANQAVKLLTRRGHNWLGQTPCELNFEKFLFVRSLASPRTPDPMASTHAPRLCAESPSNRNSAERWHEAEPPEPVGNASEGVALLATSVGQAMAAAATKMVSRWQQ